MFGLKPTYGRLSRARSFPFVASLDHRRPVRAHGARSRARLRRHAGPRSGRSGLRRPPGRAGDAAARPRRRRAAHRGRRRLFQMPARRSASTRIDRVAAALGAKRDIEIPEAERARAAAFIITASEGASLHLDRLRTRANDFDPAVRDRLIAGAMLPASLVDQGAEIPPLVSRATCSSCSRRSTPSWRRRRRAPAPLIGQQTFDARRRRIAGARQSRHLHAADLVHRPAGRRRAGAADAVADRRADHRARRGARTSRLRIAHALEQQGVVAAQRPPVQQR